jgi:myo-inositol-1(or 4)-monophosphatase
MINYKKYLDIAIRSSEISAHTLNTFFKKFNKVKLKNKNFRDLVSEIDFISQKEITEMIKKKFPSHNIICEEKQKGLNKKSNFSWIIDPLDGTINYIHGVPIYSISIALKFKDELIVGVINNPEQREIFYASKGNGSFMNGEKIIVSKNNRFSSGLYVAAFPSSINKKLMNKLKIFGKINNNSRGMLRLGSAAHALTYLASGKIDGFWGEDLKIWDIAAGILIINEAGGKITDLNNNKFNFKNTLVASNTLVHNDLLKNLI